MPTKTKPDLMDRLVSEWGEEAPDLEANAMQIIGRIIQLGRRFEKDAARALKPFGLQYTDFDIVATLRRTGAPYELTPGQLGKSVLLTSGAMTAALDRLEYAGLVTRHSSEIDRRVKSAKLTKAGRELAVKAATARFAAANDAIKDVSTSSRKSLARALRELLSHSTE